MSSARSLGGVRVEGRWRRQARPLLRTLEETTTRGPCCLGGVLVGVRWRRQARPLLRTLEETTTRCHKQRSLLSRGLRCRQPGTWEESLLKVVDGTKLVPSWERWNTLPPEVLLVSRSVLEWIQSKDPSGSDNVTKCERKSSGPSPLLRPHMSKKSKGLWLEMSQSHSKVYLDTRRTSHRDLAPGSSNHNTSVVYLIVVQCV